MEDTSPIWWKKVAIFIWFHWRIPSTPSIGWHPSMLAPCYWHTFFQPIFKISNVQQATQYIRSNQSQYSMHITFTANTKIHAKFTHVDTPFCFPSCLSRSHDHYVHADWLVTNLTDLLSRLTTSCVCWTVFLEYYMSDPAVNNIIII